MPALELTTNVKIADSKAFCLELSKVGAETLKRPEQYILASYTYNETLTFSGTFDPAFTLVVTGFDNLTPELNEGYSKVLFEFFANKLGVPSDRAYITFTDPGRAYVGYKGTTFAAISGSK